MHQRLVVQRDGVTTVLPARLAAIVLLLLQKRQRIEQAQQGSIEIHYAGNSVTAKITEVVRAKTDDPSTA